MGRAPAETTMLVIRRWLPDIIAGLLVLLLGLAEATGTGIYYSVPRMALLILGTAAAVGLCRFAPAWSLLLVWSVAALHLITGSPIMLIEVTIAAVAFGTARWGSRSTVWASVLSIPAGAVLAVLGVMVGRLQLTDTFSQYAQLALAFYPPGSRWQFGAVIIAMALLGVPWLAGLVLRISENARVQAVTASADLARVAGERTQAREIAKLREEQARLARDVHDVVGHSLAVILAQAESGQYLRDDDPAALKKVLATIAGSARTSLRDIRNVLSETPVREGADDLDGLIEGVRAGGQPIASTQQGTPVPLPPELAGTAFRVLQEMLTNAIRHGERGAEIVVSRAWTADTFTVSVGNAVEADRTQASIAGQGLAGMRQRVESVGGTLQVARDAETFLVTAQLPVRAGA